MTERGFQPAATPENPEAPNNAHHVPRDGACFAVACVSCVRCCGQDCPRAGNGRNNGARVSTRSNARKPEGAQQRPSASAETRCVLRCRLVSCVRCCGQDCPRAGNGRSDGARVSTRSNARKPRGAQQRQSASAETRRSCCGCLVSCVRCCGQDCPRSGIGRSDGARVSTRSNARKPKGAQQRPPRPRDALVLLRLPCVVRALLRTRLSALRDWPQ